MNVRRLDGPLLNYWVARSAGLQLSPEDATPGLRHVPESGFWHPQIFDPIHDWSHAGPLVASDWFGIEDMLVEWFGPGWPQIPAIAQSPLKWFLRAYVATQFGSEVEEVDALGSWKLDNTDAMPLPAPPVTTDAGARSGSAAWLKFFNR
jgi:hypothetical protein